jgi:hypothetical protein
VIYKRSLLLITQEIAGFNNWGSDEIEDGQKALADEALKIRTPEVNNQNCGKPSAPAPLCTVLLA